MIDDPAAMANLVCTLSEMQATEKDVPLTTVHVESTEANGVQQFKINDLHRRARFGRYAGRDGSSERGRSS